MPIFQDGRTAQAYEADVYIQADRLHIVYQDENGITQDIFWEVDQIEPEEFPGERPRLLYGRFSQQSLQFESKAELKAFQNAFPGRQLLRSGVQDWAIWQNKTALIIGLVASMAFIVWFGLYGLPALADVTAGKMPRTWEAELGETMAGEIDKQENRLPKTSALTNEFFKECHFQTSYPIKVHVLNDRTVNAYAMPDGTIVVFSGLLEKLDRPEQLASLLGHELGHVEERHSLRLLCRSLALYMAVSVLIGDAAGISAVLVDNARQIQQLNYSRELEASADDFSIAQMRQQRIDVGGMKSLFGILEKETEEQDIQVPQFLQSHPLTADRSRKAEAAAKSQIDEKLNPHLEATFRKIKEQLKSEDQAVY